MIQTTLNEIYRTKITNIIKTSTVAASMMFSSTQNISVDIKCGGDLYWTCSEMEWNQSIQGQVNFVTSVDQTQTSDIATMLKNDVENENSQTMESIFNTLSGVGEARVQTQSNEFITRVNSVITENLTSEFIVNIVNKNTFDQNNILRIDVGNDCHITGSRCKFLQNIAVEIVAENIINTLVSITARDDVVNRIVNDSKQDLKLEAKGWDVIFKSLTVIVGIAMVVIGAVLFFVVKSSPHSTILKALIKNRKALLGVLVMLCLAGSITGVLIAARVKNAWPFNINSDKWVAESVDGFKTGKCLLSPDSKYGYASQTECESSHSVDQYWGCEKVSGEFTGRCSQFKSVLDGPKRSKTECEAAVANGTMCSLQYGCGRDESGVYTFPPTCALVQNKDQALWATESECDENKSKCINRWKCSNGSCSVADPTTEWGMFETELDCKSLCKR